MKIEVYHARICGLCHKALDFFAARGLPVHAYEVEWDGEQNQWVDSETVRQMQQRAGAVDFVPQIFLDETRHIAGWRQLEPLIESGEFDRILEESKNAY